MASSLIVGAEGFNETSSTGTSMFDDGNYFKETVNNMLLVVMMISEIATNNPLCTSMFVSCALCLFSITVMVMLDMNRRTTPSTTIQIFTNGDQRQPPAVVTHNVGSTRACKPKAKSGPENHATVGANLGDEVWIAPSYGKKYHRCGCRKMFGALEVSSITVKEALDKGLTKCKLCGLKDVDPRVHAYGTVPQTPSSSAPSTPME